LNYKVGWGFSTASTLAISGEGKLARLLRQQKA
jgi:hypothetical protein